MTARRPSRRSRRHLCYLLRLLLAAACWASSSVEMASGHRCYVCKSNYMTKNDYREVEDFGHEVLPCSEFEPRRREEFVFECPGGSAGCLTKFGADGGVIRTCSRASVDDCKTMEGTTYCYCKADMCNNPDSKLADPPEGYNDHHRHRHGHRDDEEEEEELELVDSYEYGHEYDGEYSYEDDEDEEGSGWHDDTDDEDMVWYPYPDGYPDHNELEEGRKRLLEMEREIAARAGGGETTKDDDDDIVIVENPAEDNRADGGVSVASVPQTLRLAWLVALAGALTRSWRTLA